MHVIPMHFTLGVARARSVDEDPLTFSHHVAPRNNEDLLLARLKYEILLEAVERLELLSLAVREKPIKFFDHSCWLSQESSKHKSYRGSSKSSSPLFFTIFELFFTNVWMSESSGSNFLRMRITSSVLSTTHQKQAVESCFRLLAEHSPGRLMKMVRGSRA